MSQRPAYAVYLAAILILAAFLLIWPAPAHASTHLWPLSALHFEEPAPQTATFAMSEQEFEALLATANQRLQDAYEALYEALPENSREPLAKAQESWRLCYEKYGIALKAQLDTQVKVFYGQPQERKTNIYKDTLLALAEQRSEDLESWAANRYAGALSEEADTQESLTKAKALLDKEFVLNTYIMEEFFRGDMWEAQKAWRDFSGDNTAFIQTICQGKVNVLAAEELLQVQRMYALTLLHKQGSVFFHREREE